MLYPRIRDLREDEDWTQAQVAEMLHITQTCYSKYELGRRDIPTEILIELSRIHGTSTDYILGLTDKRDK